MRQPFDHIIAQCFDLAGIVLYNTKLLLQWDLFIKDTLGPANLSTVERLSTLQK